MAWLDLYAQLDGRIRIFIAPNCGATTDRIELSSGTRSANVAETHDPAHGATYQENAKLPREPWRKPAIGETQALLLTETPRDMATSVGIVKLPCEISDDWRNALKSDPQSFALRLLRPLRRICELGEPLHCAGPHANPANLKTVTINHGTGRYNGLHVDNWDGLDLNSRHLATNRICINVGKDDRYFMFLPFSLMDIATIVSKDMGPDWQAPTPYSMIGRQFMESYPDIPTVRCRLAPGEAYIAPTENLVHDGSSAGQVDIDEQVTIRGHIRLL